MDQAERALTPLTLAAGVEFRAAPADSGARAFSGTAYSGGLVTDHPLFDAVAFDLATTKLATPAPALLSHHKPVGVIDAAQIDNAISITGRLFADIDDDARKIGDMADRGMPWQMSVGIWPGRIEEVRKGASVTINGRTFEGPMIVYRDNRIREVSFTALGADDKTAATVFSVSEGGSRPAANHQESDPMPDPTPTIDKAEHDRVVAELNAQVATLTAANADLSARFAARLEAERAASIDALAKDLGREFSADERAGFVQMADATFTFVAAQLRAARPATDPTLFQAQATGGAPAAGTPTSVDDIRTKAREYMAAQEKLGRQITIHEAVTHVTRKQAA